MDGNIGLAVGRRKGYDKPRRGPRASSPDAGRGGEIFIRWVWHVWTIKVCDSKFLPPPTPSLTVGSCFFALDLVACHVFRDGCTRWSARGFQQSQSEPASVDYNRSLLCLYPVHCCCWCATHCAEVERLAIVSRRLPDYPGLGRDTLYANNDWIMLISRSYSNMDAPSEWSYVSDHHRHPAGSFD